MDGSATLIAVASAGHSGSTLLDLLVGSHSQVCSAGEMNRLTLHAPDRVCACGATVTNCDFWNHVRALITTWRGRPTLIGWDECHTDVPPQEPVLRLEGAATGDLVDGAVIPEELRRRMAAGGVMLNERATLSRHGARDFKWRVTDPITAATYVLRHRGRSLDVYSSAVAGKNPLRVVPSLLETALALGAAAPLKWAQACSSTAADLTRIAVNSWSVVDAMAEVRNARFVIDSSKSPVRLKLLYMLHPDRVRVLHLVRDGRAVAASAMRRRDVSASTAARIWKRDNQNIAVMLRSIPRHLKLGVRYEALCEDPERELDRICHFLDLEFESGMTTLWAREVHNIPGNPMLFDRHVRTIRKDERWRRDLADTDLEAFGRAAGRLNRSLGYV
jgi:hypothetical protein